MRLFFVVVGIAALACMIWVLNGQGSELGDPQTSSDLEPKVASRAIQEVWTDGDQHRLIQEPELRAFELRAFEGVEGLGASVIAINEQNEVIRESVALPARLLLPRKDDWLVVCFGSEICDQLVFLRGEGQAEIASDTEVVWLVPSGGVDVSVVTGIGEEWTGEESIDATIRVDALPLEFPEGGTGVLLGAEVKRTVRNSTLEEIRAYFNGRTTVPEPEELRSIFSGAFQDSRLAALASASLANSLLGSEFGFKISSSGTQQIAGLPSQVECRWRIYYPGAFQVHPIPDVDLVHSGGSGFTRKLGERFRTVWSERFVIPQGGVFPLSATLFNENELLGRLDFSQIEGEVSSSRISVFTAVQDADAQGQSLVAYEVECVVYPDELGVFSVKGLLPGLKRIAAVWKNEIGDVCVASRIFEMPIEGAVDLGLVRAESSQLVTLDIALKRVDLDEQVTWESVFGQSTPGAVTMILKNGGKKVRAEDDFWEAIYPTVGSQVRIQGLAASDWHVTVMAGGAETDWPMPLEELIVNSRMQEFDIDTTRPVHHEVEFEVAQRDDFTVELAIPGDAASQYSGNELFLSMHLFSRGTGERTKLSLIFKRGLGTYFAKMPNQIAPAFIVIFSNKGAMSLVGTAELSKADVQGGRTVRVSMAKASWVSWKVPIKLSSRLKTGAVQLDIDTWPTTAKPHFIAILEEGGEIKFGPVPDGAIVTERTLGLIGVVEKGELVRAN